MNPCDFHIAVFACFILTGQSRLHKKKDRIRFDQTNNWKDLLLNGAFPGQSEKIYVSVNLSELRLISLWVTRRWAAGQL